MPFKQKPEADASGFCCQTEVWLAVRYTFSISLHSSLIGVVSVLLPRFLFALPLSVILLLLAACMAGQSSGSISQDEAWADLCRRGAEKQLFPHLFKAGEFYLCGLLRLPACEEKTASKELVVYIEGDGRIFDERGRVRSHPTPEFAQSCELALKDPAPCLLYLARIGQFNPRNQGRIFQKYWTNARMSPEALLAAGQAIDQARKLSGAGKIQLIGYSGGGGLASLLAARRSDVSSLITVAAVLDSEWWTRSWLPASQKNSLNLSLNPADWATHFASLPQLHFSGSQDSLVPPAMVYRLQNAASFKNFRHIVLNNSHAHGWLENWPQLLKDYIIPLRSSGAASVAQN